MKRKPAPAVKLDASVGQIAASFTDELYAAFVAYLEACNAAWTKADAALTKALVYPQPGAPMVRRKEPDL
jgi:hypothetical protein